MRWQGGRRGGNIDDRRGMGGAGIAGGGIGALVLAAIGYFVFGIPPETTQQITSQLGGVGSAEQGTQGSPQDQAGAFVDVIGTNVDDVWRQKLPGYQPPTVTLYEQGAQTGCGFGQAAMGPFYCPTDRHVYLDLSFWAQMESQLGASGADFARAYVIAHEYGSPTTTSWASISPVSRFRAEGFETLLPARTTFR